MRAPFLPFTRTRRALQGAANLLLLAGALLAPSLGCQSRELPAYMVTFHFEVGSPQGGGEKAVMPVSGLEFRYNKDAKLLVTDLQSINLAKLPSGAQCLVFQFKPPLGRNKLYRETTLHQGTMLLAFVQSKPVAAVKIDQPITNGELYMWPEVPEEQLGGLVLDMQDSLKKVQEIQRKK